MKLSTNFLCLQCQPLEMKIHVSAEWLNHIRNTELDGKEKNRHDHLLLVKGLREVGHILTPIFMERIENEKAKNKKRKRSKETIYVTPKKIGTMKSGKKIIGDAGYGLEELLSGGRMFHEHSKDGGMFSIESLAIEKRKGNDWKRFEIPDSFLSSDMKSLELFHTARVKLVDINSTKSVKTRKRAELFPLSNCIRSNTTSFTQHGTSSSSYRRI